MPKQKTRHDSDINVSVASSHVGLPAMTSHYDVIGTAHDWDHWEREKRSLKHKKLYDDGTMTFFWRAHHISMLLLFASVIVYVGLFEEPIADQDYNTKRGIFAVILAFVLFGATHMPDGPFIRPHPVLWRFTMILSIVYLMAVVFLLFQDVDHARQLLRHLDPNLGKPLADKDYGGNCLIYDPNNATDPWHNVWDKMDLFVTVHFLGWWAKTLVLRDFWLCMVFSVMFEVMEYTFEHQLPNFNECWWDHFLMDILICNGLGIFMGMQTMNWLSMKTYNWQGMWKIPTYRGKIMRAVKQFTPYSWTEFDWSPTSSLKRWLFMIFIITSFLIIELNTFYLKYILWLPPDHFIVQTRLIIFLFWGAVGMRETFQYLDDPKCKVWGTQAWLCTGIAITELIVVCKFDWKLVSTPLPKHMQYFWVIFISCLVVWTVWHFYIQRLLWHNEHIIRRNDLQTAASSSIGKGGDYYEKKSKQEGTNTGSHLSKRKNTNKTK